MPDQLSFGLHPEDLRLELTGLGANARTLAPLIMTARQERGSLPACGRLLYDVLPGDAAPSIRGVAAASAQLAAARGRDRSSASAPADR